jgi:hypothetical protein
MGKKSGKAKRTDDSSDDDAPQKKRGQPSDFKGARLEFLTSQIPQYIEASKKKSGKEAKTEGLAPFWTNLFKEYWKLFPWDLPLDQDPVPTALPLELDHVPNGPPAPDLEPQTAEEAVEALKRAEQKSQVQKKIKEVGSHLFFYS